jgi:uncharacterized membrane protein YfcA
MPLIAVAGAGVAAGAALQSATGFGFALVAAPLLFAALGPAEAVGLMLILGLEANVLTLATERRRPRPLKRHAALLLAWGIPGALAGVAVLRALDPVALQIALTLGVAATLLARRIKTAPSHRPPVWAAPAAGFSAGAFTTSTSINGPPLLVYLLGRGADPGQLRDTITVCFLGFNGVGALALLVTGTTAAAPDPAVIAALVPVVAIGHLAGRPAFARLARGGRYEPVLTAVLIVSVLAGLAGAIA